MTVAIPEAKVLPPQTGEAYFLVDSVVTFKAVGAETGGAYTLFEGRTPPGGGVPPHIHEYEEESFFVLEGTFAFSIGERMVEFGPGGFIFGPRGIPHSFRNAGRTPGRLLTLVTPGGLFEQFTAEVGRPLGDLADVSTAAPPDVARLMAVATKYGIDFLPPPVE